MNVLDSFSQYREHFERLAKHYDRHINREIVNDICQIKKLKKKLKKDSSMVSSDRLKLLENESYLSMRHLPPSNIEKLDKIFLQECDRIVQQKKMDTDDDDDRVIPFDPLPLDRVQTNAQTETPKRVAKSQMM
ncbi:UNKNOWN [Stylonychia lemnae]|uniref:Uncharacterized protein n=1 Tax=Stylonychia lemnae TaxID=5949 RepID=A0A078B3A9_STYLE|nr:UNKNOWN [Stylonychia lemnae]|eukprot:CDW87727.1 UNKNOWN [Stylonychia lemnae]